MRFKIDWACLIFERKLAVFALLYFVFETISKYKEGRSDLTEGFLCYEFGGLIFGGDYT